MSEVRDDARRTDAALIQSVDRCLKARRAVSRDTFALVEELARSVERNAEAVNALARAVVDLRDRLVFLEVPAGSAVCGIGRAQECARAWAIACAPRRLPAGCRTTRPRTAFGGWEEVQRAGPGPQVVVGRRFGATDRRGTRMMLELASYSELEVETRLLMHLAECRERDHLARIDLLRERADAAERALANERRAVEDDRLWKTILCIIAGIVVGALLAMVLTSGSFSNSLPPQLTGTPMPAPEPEAPPTPMPVPHSIVPLQPDAR